MNNLLYVASVGLNNVEKSQAIAANNLANVSTTGFRGDLAKVMNAEVSGAGHAALSYGVVVGHGVDMSHGTRIDTGRELDFAVDGDGLISIGLPDGSEGYTRDGSLQIDQLGRLLTSRGMPVQGQGGPIAVPPFETLLIGADGTITVRPEGQGPEALVQVDRIKLVNPEAAEVAKHPSGYLVAADGVAFRPDIDVTVTSGVLETSNINAVSELTEILALSRQYELEVRVMRVAEENDEAASQLLRIG